MKNLIYILFIFLLFKSNLLSTSYIIKEPNFDSLISEIPKYKLDTNKVNYLLEISKEYYFISDIEGIKYGKQALELAKELYWDEGIAKCLYNLGVLNEMWDNDIDEALNNYLGALKIYEEIGNKHLLYGTYSQIGNIFLKLSNYKKAIEYFELDLFLAEDIYKGSYSHLIYNLENLYNAYEKNGEYQKALKTFKKYVEFKNIIQSYENEEKFEKLKKDIENDLFIKYAIYGSGTGLIIVFILSIIYILIRKIIVRFQK